MILHFNIADLMILKSGIQLCIQFPKFLKTYLLLKESQFWSKEKLEEYQLEQLKLLLDHSYQNVPYYTKLFNKIKIIPKDIKTLQNLHKIPYLTKDIVRDNSNDLKAKNYPKHKFGYLYTGGSTGQPLRIFIEKGVWPNKMMAFGKIQNEWTGRSFYDKCLFIMGDVTPFKYRLFGRTLVLSSFYLNDKHFSFFITKIQKFKPKYIYGYPSAITNLAIYMKRNNLKLYPNIKSIISFSETLYDWQRNLLEEIFQCQIYQQYSLRESVALGLSCTYSDFFHMFPEFGIIELIGKDGKPVTKENELGEIVGTGFQNFIFPFIRYRTGDLGVYTKDKCACGKNYPLLKRIEGRLQEFVVTKTKQLISLTGVYGLIAMCSTNVKECQLYQDRVGEIILNLVKTQNYSKTDDDAIQRSFKKRFGNQFNLTLCYVDQIPRTKGGKYQFLIQKLPIEFNY